MLLSLNFRVIAKVFDSPLSGGEGVKKSDNTKLSRKHLINFLPQQVPNNDLQTT